MWLAELATGDLADALDRDLRSDQLQLDDLGWRGLWAYITAAQPGTALHYARSEGWTIGDKIAAESLYEQRKLGWRYTALKFEGGKESPFPEPVPYPGSAKPDESEAQGWQDATLEDLVSPQVRALLKGA